MSRAQIIGAAAIACVLVGVSAVPLFGRQTFVELLSIGALLAGLALTILMRRIQRRPPPYPNTNIWIVGSRSLALLIVLAGGGLLIYLTAHR